MKSIDKQFIHINKIFLKNPIIFPDSTHVQKTSKRRLKDVLKSSRRL